MEIRVGALRKALNGQKRITQSGVRIGVVVGCPTGGLGSGVGMVLLRHLRAKQVSTIGWLHHFSTTSLFCLSLNKVTLKAVNNPAPRRWVVYCKCFFLISCIRKNISTRTE